MGNTFVNRGQSNQPFIHLCQLTYDMYDSIGYKERELLHMKYCCEICYV